ncbi:MAG: 2-oxoglutarate dehydrogenase complex dihydrolipoyllysine-residue succinyltransferase [Pseudomonadota bacterium]|nr:2-oxoglutarate dehydrogenase complex dihydrolipoyllysine-residue succinyltransferase [Pseudomonadota bacterium]MDP1906232.1 2-oxoglutarate dehydrogenase complex dihydrolipoyllysine-residue succinyltransferase [Pseudomonadota bacterium]MDP2352321.1 2-oxoglutarate dehydrogenase complex dihydrolipoyllysine-residue succinyltransferase [Pseudomonadota bacterium]
MMIEVKTPEMSESVQSGALLAWRKQAGDAVRRDETLLELETDKVILEVAAPADGVLAEIRVPVGGEVKAGDVLALIDTEARAAASPEAPPAAEPVTASVATPEPVPSPLPRTAPDSVVAAVLPPSARREHARLDAPEKPQPAVVARGGDCPPCPKGTESLKREERRVRMSRLRQRIAERLKEAQNSAAMLTTFNEINMQPVMDLRAKYQERFQKEHGVKLGFMSFFTKAACQALKAYPLVNASVDGRDILYHDFCDVGIAVSSERGLVVPILRNAEHMSFSTVEKQIANFGRRANSLELGLEEMEGGTFTISNGGVFGSLLSTPILNPPQSGVLGLHKIQDRPIAENGQVVIRPMMYVALSYDHRIVDGREAVSFLKAVKDALEDPARLLLEL